LTAFVLAILGSVVSTLNTAKTSQVAVAASPTQEILPTDLPTQVEPTATTAVTTVSPEQAASIAAQFLNKTDVYSVETTALNGVNVFKVVFSAGDIVYVGLDGVVISTEVMKPAVVYVEPTVVPQKKHKSGGNNNISGGGNTGGVSTGGGSTGGGDDSGDDGEPQTEHEVENDD
jgi:uncharacterized membrane protein YgcG